MARSILIRMKEICYIRVLAFILLCSTATFSQATNEKGWKAGVASVIITPEEPMWMAGYGGRTRPSEGTLSDLWAKVLAFEDVEGHKSVLITLDLSGIPKTVSDRMRNNLKSRYGLSRDQIIINTSHTHSGPVLTDALHHIYPLDSIQLDKINRYTLGFEKKVLNLVGEALESMKPVTLYSGNGVVRFQVNRRNNNEGTLHAQTELNGPNDYAVPVLKVVDYSDQIIAIAFGYACHNTVLGGYQWSGDYSGYAQTELENRFPGATALFFQGCGGNQNPLPRRTVELAKQYGYELAAAVEGMLHGNLKELTPHLKTSYSEINLKLNELPARNDLVKFEKESSGHYKAWAAMMIDKMDRNETIRTTYPYPIQVWQMGNQMFVALGGEPVIEYATELKMIFGKDIFVLGYSNDVMAYIPNTKILSEGGYEGATSQMAFGLPSTWSFSIESDIINETIRLARTINIEPLNHGLIK